VTGAGLLLMRDAFALNAARVPLHAWHVRVWSGALAPGAALFAMMIKYDSEWLSRQLRPHRLNAAGLLVSAKPGLAFLSLLCGNQPFPIPYSYREGAPLPGSASQVPHA